MADEMSPVRRAAERAREAVRARRNTKARVAALEAQIRELEDDVQECRRLNLRLAELTDLVQELLVPLAQRDHERVAELVERYRGDI